MQLSMQKLSDKLHVIRFGERGAYLTLIESDSGAIKGKVILSQDEQDQLRRFLEVHRSNGR